MYEREIEPGGWRLRGSVFSAVVDAERTFESNPIYMGNLRTYVRDCFPWASEIRLHLGDLIISDCVRPREMRVLVDVWRYDVDRMSADVFASAVDRALARLERAVQVFPDGMKIGYYGETVECRVDGRDVDVVVAVDMPYDTPRVVAVETFRQLVAQIDQKRILAAWEGIRRTTDDDRVVLASHDLVPAGRASLCDAEV